MKREIGLDCGDVDWKEGLRKQVMHHFLDGIRKYLFIREEPDLHAFFEQRSEERQTHDMVDMKMGQCDVDLGRFVLQQLLPKGNKPGSRITNEAL